MSADITKEDILACKGMTRQRCANKLGISISELKFLILKYKLQGFFKNGAPKCPRGKQFYLSMVGVKTPEEIAEEKGVCLETVKQNIRRHGLNDEFGIQTYGEDKLADDPLVKPLTQQVEVKCYNGCEGVMRKDVSMDVINGITRMPRFMCHDCKNRDVETVYSYPGL